MRKVRPWGPIVCADAAVGRKRDEVTERECRRMICRTSDPSAARGATLYARQWSDRDFPVARLSVIEEVVSVSQPTTTYAVLSSRHYYSHCSISCWQATNYYYQRENMLAKWCIYIWAIWEVLLCSNTTAEPIRLGGLFEESDTLHRFVFAFAVDQISDDRPHQYYPVIESVRQDDVIKSYRKACDMLTGQAITLFTHSHDLALAQTRSLCHVKRVPHVTFAGAVRSRSPLSINLHPNTGSVGRAVAAVVTHYDWKSMVILYEHDQGIIDLQAVLSLSASTIAEKVPPQIVLRKLEAHGDYRPLLKQIKSDLQEFHLIVHTRHLQTVRTLMEQASAFGMTADYYHYVFTNLDTYTLDMDDYKQSGCNITTFRIIDTHSYLTETLIRNMRVSLEQQEHDDRQIPMPSVGLYASTALLYDSVLLLGAAIKRVSLTPTSLTCANNDSVWRDGANFIEAIQKTEITGTTGRIRVDANGNRVGYRLDVIELRKAGYSDVGTYHQDADSFNITYSPSETLDEALETLENRTLRVTVFLEEPFVMKKRSSLPLHGNDQYEGYCIDLLKKIATYRNFNFTIQEVKDHAYGAKDENGQWSGLVGELVRNEADLAMTALTISYSRSEVIDFTVPFMHLGISILFKRPKKKDPGLFTFLSPLSLDVWIYLLASYIGVSMMLWILARFSPYEWYNPHPCDPETDVVENQFSLLNSFWFTVGSLMQQGSDLTPRAASTRLVAGIWWFFTLILISSYTANLAAFLTVERMVTPIENADDLATQTRIQYGTLGRGSTMTFFKDSKIQTYERMWAFMSNSMPSVFVNTSKGGIERVKAGDYAYLMESSMLEYAIERDCELMQIGGLLDSKGYGIGLRKGSKFREAISTAILMLQEKTELTELKEKWWKKNLCHDGAGGLDSGSGRHNELGLKNVGGVFVILFGGLCVAILLAIVEFVFKCRKQADELQVGLCMTMCKELRFAMRCHHNKKPVARSRSDSESVHKPTVELGGGVDDSRLTVPSPSAGRRQAYSSPTDYCNLPPAADGGAMSTADVVGDAPEDCISPPPDYYFPNRRLQTRADPAAVMFVQQSPKTPK